MSELTQESTLTRSTVKITALVSNNLNSVGTGFLYQVCCEQKNIVRFFIITNKHVIAGADHISFVISQANSLTDLDEFFQPINREDKEITLSLEDKVINHPNIEVDLCAIDVTVELGLIITSGKKIRSNILDSSWIVSEEDKRLYGDVEPVLVIGYPIGLWDTFNNLPISRTGTTATGPLSLYNGKTNFLIDVPIFGGASGSPVFLYETPTYRSSEGRSLGSKISLIGVVWGTIEQNVRGELVPENVPTNIQGIPIIKSSLNLGLALHISNLLDIENIIREEFEYF